LVRNGYFGRYLRSGHLLYMHEETLFAAPFDLDRLEIEGPFAPAIEHVAEAVGTGSGQLAVSDNGTAVYLSGESGDSFAADKPRLWSEVRFSPRVRGNPVTAADPLICTRTVNVS
jgi:hypothetical protein